MNHDRYIQCKLTRINITCLRCNEKQWFAGLTYDDVLINIAREKWEHETTFTGVCPRCQREQERKGDIR